MRIIRLVSFGVTAFALLALVNLGQTQDQRGDDVSECVERLIELVNEIAPLAAALRPGGLIRQVAEFQVVQPVSRADSGVVRRIE